MCRKQSKHKSTPILSAPINTKQKRQQTNIKSKTPILAQQKVTSEINREETQGMDYLVKPSSTLLATVPVFIPYSSLVQPNKTNDILLIEDTTSSYWNSNDYLSSNPVQQHSLELRTTTSTFPTYSSMNYTMDN
ncbi:unnamed protein product [Adineta steineri]|uniref:Uncharacterized protein n=1 Tax=Adineta steineri TaxID=433720 RepID=A0A818YU61_9BILA|nr:unnamed protein product [Adineta steineri]